MGTGLFFFSTPTFFFNCSSSSILTQDFIAPSGKGITPDSLLTGVGQMCMCAQQSVNNDDVSVLKHKFYWQLEREGESVLILKKGLGGFLVGWTGALGGGLEVNWVFFSIIWK